MCSMLRQLEILSDFIISNLEEIIVGNLLLSRGSLSIVWNFSVA